MAKCTSYTSNAHNPCHYESIMHKRSQTRTLQPSRKWSHAFDPMSQSKAFFSTLRRLRRFLFFCFLVMRSSSYLYQSKQSDGFLSVNQMVRPALHCPNVHSRTIKPHFARA